MQTWLRSDAVFIDDHVLMALPELYRHSKNHEYFSIKLFLIYMFDGVVQVRSAISSCVGFGLTLRSPRSSSSSSSTPT